MLHFLFPSDPFEPKQADEAFRTQLEALRSQGFGTSVFSLEELQQGNFKVRGPIPEGATIVYRGWMLSGPEYAHLVEFIYARGATPLTSIDQYLGCHHLPNWYPAIADLTAETKVYPADVDLAAVLADLDWGKYFLKDYVKSLKTSVGSVITRPEEAAVVLAEMKKFRGTIEGGLCVRRFESFQADSERRFFVLRGSPHGASGEVPFVVAECARRINSPFFSVDVALRTDGTLRVVELGDGQVSDLVGWSENAFAEMWRTEG